MPFDLRPKWSRRLTPETAAPVVREYIAERFNVAPEKIVDDLDLYVDLCYRENLSLIRDHAEEVFCDQLCWDFKFEIDKSFDFNRHFPKPNYPEYEDDRMRFLVRGCLLMPLLPFILLLMPVAALLVKCGVPEKMLRNVRVPTSVQLPPKVPRELLPDNYVPLTVGDIVRAVETGRLVVDYSDKPKSPRDV